MLKITNLTIRYPEVVAIDDVSLELKDGILYGLIGPNGAGKSSLFKALAGLIGEYEGNIYYDQCKLKNERHKVKAMFGFAPEDPDLFSYLTGREYLSMIGDIRRWDASEQIKRLVVDFGLEETIDDLVYRYSHGMRQKISFVAALIGEPQHLILDEALNGFDPISLFNAKKLLKDMAGRGKLILLSSHVLELLDNWCEEIIILNQGKFLAQYTLEQIRQIKSKTGKTFNEHFVELIHGAVLNRK
jgi:ABC-2 type transport system ATP-binding protein